MLGLIQVAPAATAPRVKSRRLVNCGTVIISSGRLPLRKHPQRNRLRHAYLRNVIPRS